jgi:hypothetical protein
MSLVRIINNLDFDSIPSQFIYDQYGQPIEVRYVGNHTDPQTQLSYFVYATNDRTPVYVPQPLAPHQYPLFHDDYPADPMESPRQRPRRQRTSRQESARQRRLTRRAARREAIRESQMQRMFANPGNLFMNPEPMEPMHRPASPVNQAPDPNSKRSRRKASRQQRQQRAANIASGWIYGGAITKRRRRH